ncbi:MAG: long-chain fatty acid--CoA ligase [Syntrophobacterales bacterium CG_4_8_14_3_um_filter_58_8]|nr:MAG: long-chain fatty acid--CoA ligase [Syntrophaceae bacterium CG2_30_58_14]PIV00753.1 MAG: long-chain fatty acid--CoA ligase [Syntrophobacterales bacterium CG03_land_8_20_14_0_80_58_14]PJC71480.1 MAG: long-chain fatty acid--CoA ligase [Syntrophobacterales bacterium CG_4_8_14_3_um_filter_58_8]
MQTTGRRADATAVIYLGTRYSYRRLEEMTRIFAAALTDLGIRPGQKVMLYIPNGIQWVAAWLGIQRMGGVCVPITPIYPAHDVQYIANDCEAAAILCADTNFGYVKKAWPETGIRKVIVTRMADLLPAWKRGFGYLFDVIPKGKIVLDENTFGLRQLLHRYRHAVDAMPAVDPCLERTAEILYTGGTTKYPKGVPINHDLFLISADEQIRMSEPLVPAEENVILGNAPLFHILGQTTGLATLLVGGTLILLPRINMDAALDAIQRFKVKSMIGVPMLYRMILEHVRLAQYDLSSVLFWFSGGDVLPVEVSKRWREKFGRCIYQGYGATETCGGVTMCPVTNDNPARSAGRPVASKKVRIIDPATLKPVEPGQPGELIVHSAHMVTSYLNKPEETAEAFIEMDGLTWYRTADVMSMDEAGNFFFVDRTVDTIKHKGYRVSASEIEAVLQEHPAVIGACVIGIPDKLAGERIKAYVVLKEDIKGITGYDLIKWCRQTLVSYKIPQYIEFRDMLPKSKVGKLLRREVRDEEGRRADG